MLGFSCKKTEREGFNFEKPLPAQCTNGKVDYNEIGVDCGGPCPACSMVAPCQPSPNTSILISQGFTKTYSSVFCNEGPGYFSLITNGVEIDIYGTTPTKDAIFKVVDETLPNSLNAGEAIISDVDFWTIYGTSGIIYVSVDGGSITATYCDVRFGSSGNMSTGSITCD